MYLYVVRNDDDDDDDDNDHVDNFFGQFYLRKVKKKKLAESTDRFCTLKKR